MSNSYIHRVVSVPASNFTEALAQNQASAVNNIPLPNFGSRQFIVRGVKVIAKENYGPEVNLFGKAAGATTDPATDSAIARWGFVSANGEQLGGSGLWRYYIDGLAIPYVDADWLAAAGSGGLPPTPPSLHVVLQNISATAKSANAAGSTKVVFYLEPMQAF